MKGGKADKPRKSSSSKPSNPRAGANKPKSGARPANVAPPKGSRKRPESGGSSSKGED